MRDIVFLPATEPGDETYGAPPERIEAYPDLATHQVRFPTLVWYNEAVREAAIAQVRSLGLASVLLVGFSKSGLGAWNIARTIPDIVVGTIIFDAPVAREERPGWGTAAFYESDASWRQDLPIRGVESFRAAAPETHTLALISGEAFHEEMRALSRAATRAGVRHVFLPRPNLKHHWRSGWIEEGLSALFGQDGQGPSESQEKP